MEIKTHQKYRFKRIQLKDDIVIEIPISAIKIEYHKDYIWWLEPLLEDGDKIIRI